MEYYPYVMIILYDWLPIQYDFNDAQLTLADPCGYFQFNTLKKKP